MVFMWDMVLFTYCTYYIFIVKKEIYGLFMFNSLFLRLCPAKSKHMLHFYLQNLGNWWIEYHFLATSTWKKDWELCNTNHPRSRAYQGVRNVRFSENLACFVFLLPPFWDSPFCLITDELLTIKKFALNITPERAQDSTESDIRCLGKALKIWPRFN